MKSALLLLVLALIILVNTAEAIFIPSSANPSNRRRREEARQKRMQRAGEQPAVIVEAKSFATCGCVSFNPIKYCQPNWLENEEIATGDGCRYYEKVDTTSDGWFALSRCEYRLKEFVPYAQMVKDFAGITVHYLYSDSGKRCTRVNIYSK